MPCVWCGQWVDHWLWWIASPDGWHFTCNDCMILAYHITAETPGQYVNEDGAISTDSDDELFRSTVLRENVDSGTPTEQKTHGLLQR